MLSAETPTSALSGEETYYPSGDDMGESGLQFLVCHALVELLSFYFEHQRRTMLVAGNQYMYWRKDDPSACIAPDVYVIADEATPLGQVESWQTWEHGGKGPCLAVEVVAAEPRRAAKDYEAEMLARYEALGVQELVRYDPHHGPGRRVAGQRRRLLTHWVRTAEGRLVESPLAHPYRARSAQLDLWLVHVPQRGLVVGYGPEGTLLWPTRAEAQARRAEAEAQRAEAEAQRAEAEAQRAEAAEAREAELRAELERLRAERR